MRTNNGYPTARSGADVVRLADWPVLRMHVDLRTYDERPPGSAGRTNGPELELLAVADLESQVDRDALLRGDTDLEPPYWAIPWLGARAIAALLHEWPPPRGARVIDLGCGLGLAGIAAGRCGAHVLFADINEQALQFAAANARLHGIASGDVQRVDFTRDRLGERFDWILAADIVYEPGHYDALVAFLDRHLAPKGRILLTESLRADAKHVIERLARAGISGPRRALWLIENGRAERTWLHVLERG